MSLQLQRLDDLEAGSLSDLAAHSLLERLARCQNVFGQILKPTRNLLFILSLQQTRLSIPQAERSLGKLICVSGIDGIGP